MRRVIAPLQRDLQRSLDVVVNVLPDLNNVILRMNNPYTLSKLSSDRRHPDFRQNLIRAVYGRSQMRSDKIECMLSGEQGNGLEVVAAHIVPASTSSQILEGIPMTKDEVLSVRNGLFLSKEVEVAFDNLQISFIPKDVLHPETLVMVIWKDEVRSTPLWKQYACNGMESSVCTLQIGQFAGHALKLKGHDPIRRGLAYQAGMAYNLLTEEERVKFVEPSWFGTPSQKPPILERIAAGRSFALSTEYNEDATEDEEESSSEPATPIESEEADMMHEST